MPDNGVPERRNNRDIVRIVLVVVLAVVLVALIAANTREVKIGYVVGEHKTRLIYVLVIAAVIGALLDRLWMHRRRRD